MGCIYIYTNKINGKQYIGQTSCSLKKRHMQHLHQNETYFDKALKKYGFENFNLDILEDNIFDAEELNQKEIYYIDKFDTFNNGYNMTRGGNTLPIENITYPIRTRRNTQKFFQEDIEAVIELLKTTDFSFDKIAEITNTNLNFVIDVNRGKRKFSSYNQFQFPIRKNKKHIKLSNELFQSIIFELQKDELSERQIGELLNIPSYTVGQINRGKHSLCKSLNISFPIRKKQYRNKTNYSGRKIDDEQLIEIIDLLLNTYLSTEEIARRYDVNKSTIDRINRGVVFKPVTNKYKLPIRQNRQYNLQIG